MDKLAAGIIKAQSLHCHYYHHTLSLYSVIYAVQQEKIKKI